MKTNVRCAVVGPGPRILFAVSVAGEPPPDQALLPSRKLDSRVVLVLHDILVVLLIVVRVLVIVEVAVVDIVDRERMRSTR